MRSARLWLLLLGLAVVLLLTLWLALSLAQLYQTIAALSSPTLATLMVVGVLMIFGVLIAGLLFILLNLWRGRQKKVRPPVIPESKSEAVSENLRSIRRQVSQIQDEVARQSLLAKSQSLESSATRQYLKIVVFGAGSAGKTSLVNALIGRMAGRVSPTIGTTTVGETYQFSLPEVAQDLWITDTPGLLEVGVAGTAREQAARQLATEADLLLFLVEGDLTQSEYRVLRSLLEIGKRLLLVFNKTDRYPPPDRTAVLDQIADRVRGQLDPDDIVAIAAHPQPVQLASGEWLQPDPDLQALLKPMAQILVAEGADLLADNLLLQSMRLGDEARQMLERQRLRNAEKIVERFQWIGAGVIWVTPIPVVDLLAAAAVNAQMVVEIGQVYGCELTFERGRELALSLIKTLAGLGIVRGVIEIVTLSLELSIGGYLIGKSIHSISAAYLTRIAGKSFIEYFRQDQDWGDGGISEVVQRQYELNRREEFIKAFVQEAIAKLPEHFSQLMHKPETQESSQD
ncbi:YcjF family protein [Lyngbya confervoides]|uniref:GTP-binding protein n=1 Tax=Lyngbya confervoides BDU141951 TaxID=1574623 RepID=A0ABD4T2B6_9CYAN|nr:GTP-binding protein [Lyngbya confervoides]MCM1982794.1 GTP-binding protein [Lyngbya confervoides BDU141951]